VTEFEVGKGIRSEGQDTASAKSLLPLNFKNIEDKIFEELSRLRQLETSIEAVLSVLGATDQSFYDAK